MRDTQEILSGNHKTEDPWFLMPDLSLKLGLGVVAAGVLWVSSWYWVESDHIHLFLMYLLALFLALLIIPWVSPSKREMELRWQRSLEGLSYLETEERLKTIFSSPEFKTLPEEKQEELRWDMRVSVLEEFERHKELKALLEENRDDEGMYYDPELLTHIYYREGNYQKALEILEPSLKLAEEILAHHQPPFLFSSSGWTFAIYAKVLIKLNKEDEAFSYLKKALKRNPNLTISIKEDPVLAKLKGDCELQTQLDHKKGQIRYLTKGKIASQERSLRLVQSVFAITFFPSMALIAVRGHLTGVPLLWKLLVVDVLVLVMGVLMAPQLARLFREFWFSNRLLSCPHCSETVAGFVSFQKGRCPHCQKVIKIRNYKVMVEKNEDPGLLFTP